MTPIRFALIVVCCLAASACIQLSEATGVPNPFDISKPYEGKLRNPIAARGITLGANIHLADVSGLPSSQAQEFISVVQDAARAKDIPLSTDDAANTAEKLTGVIDILEEANQQTLSVQWNLANADGAVLKSFVVTAPLGALPYEITGQIPVWQRLSPAQIEGLGKATAMSLRNIMDEAQGRDPVRSVERKNVLLLAIYDAPGDGRRTLTSSLSHTLKEAGYPVTIRWDATLPTPIPSDSIVVAGWVEFKENAQDGADWVKITWEVRNHEGDLLGSVAQENLVPAGQLKEYWGENAYYAALGAAQGILDLLAKG